MSDSARSESPFDVDFSVIRTAIDMGHSMIEQILNGIHYGSEEVRNLLYEECEYIVECKVCRNLFRSFPNFVAHKRVYCQETHEEKLDREKAILTQSDEEAVIVEPEAPSDVTAATTKAKSPQNTVLDKVVSNQFPGKSKDYQFYTKVAENLEMRKVTKVTNTVTMTAIPSNPHAVVVSYDKGDHSEKSTPKDSPQSSGLNSKGTSEKSSPMAVDDDSPPRLRGIADICKRLATKQSEENDHGTNAVTDIGGGQTRRSRKSLPRKSTEEFIDFSAAAEDASNTSPAVNGSSATVSKIVGVVNKGTTDQNVPGACKTGVVSSKSVPVSSQKDDKETGEDKRKGPASSVSQNTGEEWMKYCDMKKIMCKKCGTRYEKTGPLKMHLIKTHALQVGDIKCPSCHKYFVSVGTMIRHMRINHKATNDQVQKTLKLFDRRKPADKDDQTGKHPVTSQNTKMDEKTPSSVNAGSALYKALTDKLEEPVQSTVGNSSSKEENKVSNIKNGSKSESLKEPYTASGRLNTRVSKATKNVGDSQETETSHTKLKTGTPGHENSNEKPVTRAQKDTKNVDRVNVPNVTDEKPATRAQKTLITDVEQKTGRRSLERDVKKIETRTSSNAKENLNQEAMASAENVKKTKTTIVTSSDGDRQVSDKGKTRAKSESSSRKEEINKLFQKNLRSKSESTERCKTPEKVSRAKSQDSCKTSGEDANRTRSLVSVTCSPLNSPTRLSVSSSVPTSPTTSINSNSCDGYSSKFKMTVKEMAELVESTSLTKFARERKKKATQILTSSKVKKPIATKLGKPLKRGVRRRILPVKKVYSTRLSTEEPLGSKGLLDMPVEEQSRKLLREMKRLQNSAGLVEDKIYSSSSPSLSARSGPESDTAASDSPRAPREKKQADSGAASRSKADMEGRARNTSSDRYELSEEAGITKYRRRDKSEDRGSNRSLSAERPKTAVYRLEDQRRSRTVPRERSENPSATTATEVKEKADAGQRSNSANDGLVGSPAKDRGPDHVEIRREARNEIDRQRQIEKTNTLRKKMFAALKSVNNSKRIMNSREGQKSDTSGMKVASPRASKADAHNHRTRLATGSIYFNSELLKLSPSKVGSLENSPKKLTSTTNSPSLSPVRRKLSLSPKRESKKSHERTRSEPLVFSLATGVKKCESCGKVFWKLRTFKNHRCQKLRKKRMFSGSPKDLGKSECTASQSVEIPMKKARVELPVKEKVIEVVSDSPSKKADIDKDKIAERKKGETEHAQKDSPKKTVNLPEQQPSNSTADNVEDDSDDDSDFSGFSKSDLIERKSVEEFDFSDVEEDNVSSDEEMDFNDLDNTLDDSSFFDDADEGLVYKSTGKRKAKSGTVEEIWVEKSTEEKNSENRQYVRDPNNPSKVVCQSNKKVDKIIDETELKCLKCNMQYTSMSNLRRHAIRHLGWKRYKCKLCAFTCYDKSECRLHYNRSHGNQLDNKNFLQYYVDLKREASKKRNAKRVTTMRKKETVNNQEEDPYRKPRQTVVVKAAKDAADLGAGDGDKPEVTVDKSKDSPSVDVGKAGTPVKSETST